MFETTAELRAIRLWALATIAKVKASDPNRGERGAADLATIVIITAILAAAAIAIGAIIVKKFTDKANDIPNG
jgi:hypothetical protein